MQTTSDIASNSSLEGKVAVVTGSASGIGEALCRLLLARGVHLLAVDRNAPKAAACHGRLRDAFPQARITAYQMDLADLSAVRAVAAHMAAQQPRIDYLFHNAGVLLGTPQVSTQGHEMHFAVNTLAPLALTQALKVPLAAASQATVVVSGSGARRMAQRLKVGELRRPRTFRKMTGPYAQSKQAVYLALAAMAPYYRAQGTQLRTVDLPPTRTPMARSEGMPGWLKPFGFLFASPQAAAQRLLDAALLPADTKAAAPSDRELPPTAALMDVIRQCGVEVV